MAFTHANALNKFGVARIIVATDPANGSHTTLATAMADASVGDTIFMRDSVTENVTITPGVNIGAWSGGTANTPSITGTLTMTGAGTSTISGLELITNSAAIIAVTGAAASILNVNNCYLNCTNNSGITFSSSSASATINIRNCSGDLGTTAILLFAQSSTGNLNIYDSDFTNTGVSSAANTVSAGILSMSRVMIMNPITSSGTGAVNLNWVNMNCNALNATSLTIGGSGNGTASFSSFTSGSASAVSIGATFNLEFSAISSTNTNAVTGAGTVNQYGNFYTNTSHQVNTTTATGGAANGLTQGTTPSGGMLGEQIRATLASGSATAMTTATPNNITSISLTAGIWDVSGLIIYSGASGSGNACHCSINTTSATLGTSGDNDIQGAAGPVSGVNDFGISLPSYRITLSSTTTTYLVGQLTISAGTIAAYGRISATRVG